MAITRKNTPVDVKNEITCTSVNLIHITQDKLENILNKNIQKLKKSHDWLGAAALFITFIGIIITADFKDFKFITGEQLSGIIYTLTTLSAYYLYRTVKNCMKNNIEVSDIIAEIRKEADDNK